MLDAQKTFTEDEFIELKGRCSTEIPEISSADLVKMFKEYTNYLMILNSEDPSLVKEIRYNIGLILDNNL